MDHFCVWNGNMDYREWDLPLSHDVSVEGIEDAFVCQLERVVQHLLVLTAARGGGGGVRVWRCGGMRVKGEEGRFISFSQLF